MSVISSYIHLSSKIGTFNQTNVSTSFCWGKQDKHPETCKIAIFWIHKCGALISLCGLSQIVNIPLILIRWRLYFWFGVSFSFSQANGRASNQDFQSCHIHWVWVSSKDNATDSSSTQWKVNPARFITNKLTGSLLRLIASGFASMYCVADQTNGSVSTVVICKLRSTYDYAPSFHAYAKFSSNISSYKVHIEYESLM